MDLNFIENLWSLLDSKMLLKERTNIRTIASKILQIAFENIDKNYIDNLINSIPRQLEAVIKTRSGHIKY